MYVKSAKRGNLFKNFPSWNKKKSPPITVTRTKKKLKRAQIWNKRVRFLLAIDLGDIFIFQILLLGFNLLSTSQT